MSVTKYPLFRDRYVQITLFALETLVNHRHPASPVSEKHEATWDKTPDLEKLSSWKPLDIVGHKWRTWIRAIFEDNFCKTHALLKHESNSLSRRSTKEYTQCRVVQCHEQFDLYGFLRRSKKKTIRAVSSALTIPS